MYVSNLSYNTGENELNDLFSAFGEVKSVKIITDRETGRSRGFGFVDMDSDQESQKAMTALDGKVIEGRSLSVTVAKKREENSGGFSSRRSSGNSKW
jgi:RNA recognition motif-containing protein